MVALESRENGDVKLRTRNITKGHRSEFTASRFFDAPHAISIEGFFTCTLCPKQLNATEGAVRTHLRKHIRCGELEEAKYFDTVQIVCRRRG